MREPETDEVEVTVIRETEKAYLLNDSTGNGGNQWFPKSEISFDRHNVNTGEAVAVIPIWLLEQKGWA